MRVLVVEDEAELRLAIARRLRAQGHAVDETTTANGAKEQLAVYEYGAVVLDRMLPDGDSLEAVLQWRKKGIRTPILFLTARDTLADRVAGLESGADDYLVKPFAMEELLARISSIARRAEQPQLATLQIGDLEIQTSRREVRRGGVLVPLRPKE